VATPCFVFGGTGSNFGPQTGYTVIIFVVFLTPYNRKRSGTLNKAIPQPNTLLIILVSFSAANNIVKTTNMPKQTDKERFVEPCRTL
jgi:hypothetical protein